MARATSFADKFRTVWWSRYVLRTSGLPKRGVEHELQRLRGSDDPETDTGLFSKYTTGARSAGLTLLAEPDKSYVVLAEQIAPGSIRRFLDPLTWLVYEMETWLNPHLAQRRFETQLRLEFALSLRAPGRALIVADTNARALEARVDQSLAVAKEFNRLKRVRSVMRDGERLHFGYEGTRSFDYRMDKDWSRTMTFTKQLGDCMEHFECGAEADWAASSDKLARRLDIVDLDSSVEDLRENMASLARETVLRRTLRPSPRPSSASDNPMPFARFPRRLEQELAYVRSGVALERQW